MRIINKRSIAVILVVLGSLGILDFLGIWLTYGGMNFGTVFPAVVGIVLVFLGIGLYRVRLESLNPRYAFLRKGALALVVLWLISFAAVEGIIIASGRSDSDASADYVVILGAGLHGSEPSLTLLKRLEMAADYLEKHKDMKVVVSGGMGPGETITEAEAMKRWLVGRGIDASRILKEEKSTSTMENFRFSMGLLSEKGKADRFDILVVTNDFHLFRAKFLAERVGFRAYGLGAKTPIWVLPNCYIREYFAVVKSWFWDR